MITHTILFTPGDVTFTKEEYKQEDHLRCFKVAGHYRQEAL